MPFVDQNLDDIVASLSALDVDWMDDVASSAIARLSAIPKKERYDRTDIAALLDQDFDEGILCARLFLAKSKDSMCAELKRELGGSGIGSTRYRKDREVFLDALERLGLPAAIGAAINYQPVWSDILVERLRSGRGSAITGQKRGRGLEDLVEAMVQEVFGEDGYDKRCTFTGAAGQTAKCDFAVPDRHRPAIVIEVKGYGATGSKMTDVIGDLDAIIQAMRRDTRLLFFTDGTTWQARLADLRDIVERQNQGKIAGIYTTSMRDEFVADLQRFKAEMER
jgi:hypothetical protein